MPQFSLTTEQQSLSYISLALVFVKFFTRFWSSAKVDFDSIHQLINYSFGGIKPWSLSPSMASWEALSTKESSTNFFSKQSLCSCYFYIVTSKCWKYKAVRSSLLPPGISLFY